MHRDIKPDSIYVLFLPWKKDKEDTKVKLLDFGICKKQQRCGIPHFEKINEEEEEERETSEKTEGTWAYMSPEQTGRTKRLVDYRTDFYSLGTIQLN